MRRQIPPGNGAAGRQGATLRAEREKRQTNGQSAAPRKKRWQTQNPTWSPQNPILKSDRLLAASERIESVKPLKNYSRVLASLQQLQQKLA